MKFRKKPVVIEAIQYTGAPESNREIIQWTQCSNTPAVLNQHPERGCLLSINTLEGAHWVSPGDWVIKGWLAVEWLQGRKTRVYPQR